MKEVHVMSLGGVVVALEQDAKEVITRYLAKNRARLQGNEAVDEIMEDLEAAIGAHLSEQGYGQTRAANRATVQSVLEKMGEVDHDGGEHTKRSAEDWTGIFKEPFHLSKTNKVVFGLAGGVAERLKVDAFWVRMAFVVLAFVTEGWFVGLYIAAGLVVSILDEDKPVDAQTITAQVRKTSQEASHKVARGWRKPMRLIEQLSRQVFRVIFGTAAVMGLGLGIGVLSWALVTMSGQLGFDMPLIGFARTPLAYLFVTSGLALVIWVSGLLLHAVLFPKKQAVNKSPWVLFGTLVPTLIIVSVFVTSAGHLRSHIVGWGARHSGNGFMEVEEWDGSSARSVCISVVGNCDQPKKPLRPLE